MRQPSPWRRNGGAWYAQVDGKKIRLADKGATKAQAQKELYRVLMEKGTETRKPDGQLTTKEVFSHYMVHISSQVARGERTAGCQENYDFFLLSAGANFGHVRAESVTPQHVATWLDAEKSRGPWGQTTRSHGIKVVKAAFNWARKNRHIRENPLAELERPTMLRRESIPTDQESAQLRDAFPDQELKDLLTALQETGCRPGEIYTLTADRVDLDAGTWQVLDKIRGKTGTRYRTIYLSNAMVALSRRLIERHPDGLVFRNTRGTAWTRFTVARRLRIAGERLGIGAAAHAYANRHRYATVALVNNVPIATVATLLGHRQTNMVMAVYSKLAAEKDHMREAARKARGEKEKAESG